MAYKASEIKEIVMDKKTWGLQTALAKRLQVSQSFVSNLLSGREKAGDDLALRLAKLTGTEYELWRIGAKEDRTKAAIKWWKTNGGEHGTN